MNIWRTRLKLARIPRFGGDAHGNGHAHPHRQLVRDVEPRSAPGPADRHDGEMSSGNRIIDRESIERFRQQVSLHRRYGWEIYEYGETPPQAVLAPTPSPAALRASRQRAGTDLINNVQVASRRHSWCRIWVDEGGEVRWRSVATPQTKLP